MTRVSLFLDYHACFFLGGTPIPSSMSLAIFLACRVKVFLSGLAAFVAVPLEKIPSDESSAKVCRRLTFLLSFALSAWVFIGDPFRRARFEQYSPFVRRQFLNSVWRVQRME